MRSHRRPEERTLTRRNFLGACGYASTLLLPVPLLGANSSPLGPQPAAPAPAAASLLPDYRVSPHYRSGSSLDDLLRKAREKVDDYPSERYAREIEGHFDRWADELRKNKDDLRPLQAFLSPQILAASPRPKALERIREDSILSIQRASFSQVQSLGRDAFLEEFRSSLVMITEILVAEFKVAALEITSSSPLRIATQVRYTIVGTKPGLHRFERTGVWQIEWQQNPEGRLAATMWQPVSETQSRSPQPVFVDITSTVLKDVSSYHTQMLRGVDYWRTVLDGAAGSDVYGNNGIAAGDYDNDGFDDLYICQPSGLPNRLYHNRGDGTFEDVTEAAGVGVFNNCPCALFVDLDNDGRQDLIVVSLDGPLLFLNQGNGRFEFRPDAFRFARPPQGSFTGAAVADYDRDGRLDVYFCLYSYYQGMNQYQVPTPFYDARNGPPNFLMHNNGDGTFTDRTEASGMNQNNDRYSFDCNWCDYDNDGWLDLYVVNDFGRKNLYHNNRNGTFADVAEELGVVDPGPGMSSCWFDYDNDLKFDLYVSDMWEASGMRLMSQANFLEHMPADIRALVRRQAKGNSLFHNLGNGHFEDRSAEAGIEKAGWSWSCYAWDFAHEGRPHLYIANSMISGPNRDDLESFFWQQVVSHSPVDAHPTLPYELGWNAINELIRSDGTWAGYQRNVFLHNNGDGTFCNISGALGMDFLDDSRAFALTDFDHDGRLEVVLKNRAAPQLRILRCEAAELGNALALRLRGTKSNRDAIGAVVTLETAEGRQVRMLQAGTGFASQHTKEIFFGIGKAVSARAEIRWPSGSVEHFDALPANHRIEIEEGSNQFRAMAFHPFQPLSAPPPPPVPEPPPGDCESWLIDPILAPDFELADLAGRKCRLTDLRGKTVALNFWAIWSPPSVETLRALDRSANTKSVPFQVLAVNLDKPPDAQQVHAFARENSLRVPVLLADDDVAGVYNLVYRFMFDRRRNLGLPTTLLIDAKGLIVKVYQGPVDAEHLKADCRRIPQSSEDRVRLALPFPGKLYLGQFQRNAFTYASVFLERGYLDAAMSASRLVIENDPSSAEAYYLMGAICLKKQQPEEARGNFERCLKLQPTYVETAPSAWNNLGMLAIQGGHSDEAITCFQQALRLSPNHVIALQNLGNVYRQQGQWVEARSALERAVKVDPDDAEANYSLGMVYAGQGDTQEAYNYLQRTLTLRPQYPEALNNLGILYARTGRMHEAITTFTECIHVAPDFDQAYLNLAKAYVANGETEMARGALRQLLVQHPQHSAAQKALEQLGPK